MVIALLATPVLAKPAFELPDLAGKTIFLKEYLGKEVVILSFFTSWSKSCQKEIDFLKETSKQYKDKNLEIIGISFDRKLEDLKEFVAKNEIDFGILHDKRLKTLKDFRIIIIPTLLIIDKEGNITNTYVDFDENVREAVSKEIEKILKPSKED